ncbi:MAG: GDP-mannose 4,6-dehydratase, partial [Planctomycetaceae bacterium]|nr:GDP-mannose 4,6-dehydratase [Planctomycetaceae bacterium]
TPDDYVLATGTEHSIGDFLDAAFQAVDLDWRDYVEQDPRYMRPSEVTQLVGDASKAHEKLDWSATTTLPELAKRMVLSDRKQQEQQGASKSSV